MVAAEELIAVSYGAPFILLSSILDNVSRIAQNTLGEMFHKMFCKMFCKKFHGKLSQKCFAKCFAKDFFPQRSFS